MKPYTIKVTAVTTKQTKEFDSVKQASKSTGVSEYHINQIRAGRKPVLARGNNDRLFEFQFINRDYVVTLTPAWDTSGDDNPAQTMGFASHTAAIGFLSEGGSYMCKKATYHRRKKMQPLGEPCKLPISDCWGREWIATFLTEGEFVPHRKKD